MVQGFRELAMRYFSPARCFPTVFALTACLAGGCYADNLTWAAHRDHPAGAAPAPPVAEAVHYDIDEVVDVFYDDLAPYGSWFEVQGYGWCWRPYGVVVEWRPYTVGHWVYAHEYGWTWYSLEPWGWATYHYGRWALLPHHGWVWMPGRTWAPAWVIWRHGGGYVGWAPAPPPPLPSAPRHRQRIDVDIDIDVDVHTIHADHFCFVDLHLFTRRHVHRHLLGARESVTVIQRTTNIVRIERTNERVVNRGVIVEEVERVTGQTVRRVTVKGFDSAEEFRRSRERDMSRFRENGDRQSDEKEVRVFRPRMDAADTDRKRIAGDPKYQEERRRLTDTYARQRQELEEQHARERSRLLNGKMVEQTARRQAEERRDSEARHRRELSEVRSKSRPRAQRKR
jgi:hypothetical protein